MDKTSFFNEHYFDFDVILGRRPLTIKQLKKLHAGIVLLLDKLAGEPLDVMIDNESFARGEAVIIGDNFGIRITEFVNKNEEPNQNLCSTIKETEDDQICEMDDLELSLAQQGETILDETPQTINEDSENDEKHEILSEEEIDQLLATISGNKEEYHSYRTIIKIYDFKHPVIFGKDTVENIGNFMNKVCTVLPSIFIPQTVCKLESITQLPKYDCYKNINTSFIDQWKWYSSNNYVEISLDDYAIEQIGGIKKENDYYSKNELEYIKTEISSKLAVLLLKSVENYSDNSNIPEITHVNTAPCPEFLFKKPDVSEDNWNCYEKKYEDKNSSMYLSCKIKIMSLNAKDSCGYIYINIPADDLKKYINSEYYSESDNTPNLDDIKINTYVSFGSTRKKISDIMDIGEGSIVELNRTAGEPATFFANGVPIALGEIVVIDEIFGIKLTEIL